ncbi:MAG TPA: hypothetical protein PL044_09820 [Clostridiales bacterium]|nr:MAG: hypothetical protein BWY37_02177 [Firmicutes bacterium ADurb.Bin262]HOU11197.1 hypothetical protein [Clostridiales bacterium]HQH64440.1 hypothetical protein [Clostridiales bacterium]HQK74050.1 hypothetical protein [Clostridiales bacterium]
MSSKVFVDVLVRQDKYGRTTPLSITWKDGRTYEIDRIQQVCKAASLKAGGAGIRYTCLIRQKQTYLFNDDGKWFVEAKD